jgi:hypothetical protein
MKLNIPTEEEDRAELEKFFARQKQIRLERILPLRWLPGALSYCARNGLTGDEIKKAEARARVMAGDSTPLVTVCDAMAVFEAREPLKDDGGAE